jgi:putative inorganic carbon (HCO3(-)) transporter
VQRTQVLPFSKNCDPNSVTKKNALAGNHGTLRYAATIHSIRDFSHPARTVRDSMTALFCLYLALLILRPQEIIPALTGIPILQMLLLTLLGLWGIAKDKKLFLPPFVLIGWFGLFVPLTVGLNGWWGGVTGALGQIAPVIVIFIVASMAAREVRHLNAYMWTVLLCACLLVSYCMVQLQTGMGPFTDEPSINSRPYYVGIFEDPNDLGQLFVIALTFALYLLAVQRGKLSKLLLGAGLGWLFYGIILTNSRGALLAAIAVIALDGWRRYGRIAVTVGAVLALPTLFAVTRLNQLNADEQSANDRIQAWYDGIQMLRTHPLFGVGFGSFTDHSMSSLTAHNFIVLPMAELGFPGLTLWLGIIWYSMRMLWWVAYGPHTKIPRDANTHQDQVISREILAARGLLIALVGFEISAFFLSQSYKAPLFLLCGLAVGRFAAATQVLPDPPQYHLLPDLARLGAVTLACIAGIDIIIRVTL